MTTLKKIEAIIKEEHLDALKKALKEAGFLGLTIFPVKGRGESGGLNLQWRAGTYHVDFMHKIMVMLVVEETQLQQAIDIIIENCQYDEAGTGTGKIFISSVEQAIQIIPKVPAS